MKNGNWIIINNSGNILMKKGEQDEGCGHRFKEMGCF